MGRRFQTWREARITQAGDTRFFAGWRSDPFFCDVKARRTTWSSRATISSVTKMYAASFLKYLTLL